MGTMNRSKVNINVDSSFFDNVFEKERRKLEKKIKLNSGIDKNLSQVNFTKIIARNKIRLNKDLFNIDFENGFKKRKKR